MTTKVEIHGQMGTSSYKGDGVYTIDRSFPASLHGQMSENEWRSFCDRIDSALSPLVDAMRNKWKYIMNLYFLLGLALLTVVPLIVPFIVGYEGMNVIYTTMPATFIGFFLLYLGIRNNKFAKIVRKALEDIKNVCSDESEKRPNVSFCVRDEYVERFRVINYIEVSVGSSSDGIIPGFPSIPIPTASQMLSWNNVDDPQHHDDVEASKPVSLFDQLSTYKSTSNMNTT